MLKKILCLVLGIMLSFSTVIVGMSADSHVLLENDEYVALFEAMNILPDSFVKADEIARTIYVIKYI